jgi:hypothetical protein
VFRIYETDISGDIVVDSNLTIYRPYVDPNKLGTTPEQVAEYKKYEIIARAMMDTYIGNDSANGEGFYNHKLIVQGVGEGNDYFPMWHNPKKVLRVYENNVLIYDGEDKAISVTNVNNSNSASTTFTTSINHGYAIGDTVSLTGFAPDAVNGNHAITAVTANAFTTYKIATITSNGSALRYWDSKFLITPNNSAITRVESGSYNRLEQTPLRLPGSVGDLGFYGFNSVAFPKGWDYVFILDVGYKAVPPDIEIAATMLIEDLKCNKNDYYKRFITQYDTDQFSIRYSGQFLNGTGNNVVDKILDGYKGNVIKPGVI